MSSTTDGSVYRIQTVLADQDRIRHGGGIDLGMAARQVLPGDTTSIQLEAPVGLATLGFERGDLGFGQAQGGAVVDGRQPARQLNLAAAIQLLRRVIGRIQTSRLLQPIGGVVIPVEPLRLIVALVPDQPQPGQVVLDPLFELGGRAGQVGVVDTQDERPALPLGEHPVDQGGADIAHVQLAGRRRGETDLDGRVGRHGWTDLESEARRSVTGAGKSRMGPRRTCFRFSAFPATILRHKALVTAPANLTVDLSALAHNFHALEAVAGVPVHPVVKANAYGLGAVSVATQLMAEGARTFFVARLAEGVALRAALGTEATIYVLDGCVGDAAGALQAANLRPVLNHGGQLTAWTGSGGGSCGLQIDTGMNRLGFRVDDAPEAIDNLTLVMSHLACADDPSEPMNRRQRDAFDAVTRRYPGVTRSFANSGGCFLGSDFGFDAVRPGICLFGGGPEGRPDARLKAVATMTATVLQIRDVQAGESIGYSRGFVADTPRRIATCGAGYADGVLRSNSPGGHVWAGGTLRPILGRVSMDVIAVDVTDAEITVGDSVELFGAHRPVDDVASAAGTISYEVLTSIGGRVARTYRG